MKAEDIAVVQDCALSSLRGTTTFPEVIDKLRAIGVERYHADFSREEATYYTPCGDSHVVTLSHGVHTVSDEFSSEGIAAAVRASQQGKVTYAEFLQRVMAAGCVGYFVQLTGRRALYFGRRGEIHQELFHFPA